MFYSVAVCFFRHANVKNDDAMTGPRREHNWQGPVRLRYDKWTHVQLRSVQLRVKTPPRRKAHLDQHLTTQGTLQSVAEETQSGPNPFSFWQISPLQSSRDYGHGYDFSVIDRSLLPQRV